MKMNKKVQQFVANLPSDYLVKAFQEDSNRSKNLSKAANGLRIDFSKQLWDSQIVDELIDFIDRDKNLTNQILAFFEGAEINTSENRAAKHFLLRAPANGYQDLDLPEVIKVRENFLNFSEKIFKDSNIEYLINIGIGGSELGPLMVHQALGESKKKVFYVSNVDPMDLDSALSQVDLSKTLFILVSKTFTTKETMLNAERARAAVVAALGENQVSKHFAAVTTNLAGCADFKIADDQIFGFWDWVGGRFSLASAVGISIACAYGREVFEQLLSGMHDLDLHFKNTPLKNNLAIWHALSWIYNINYLGCQSFAVIPYSFRMKYFPAFLQQLIMESNGKSVDLHNQLLETSTSPIVFGERGTNSQHSFFQLLHQGTQVVPIDFIVFKPDSKNKSSIALVANALAQASVSAFGGKTSGKGTLEKLVPGNKPSNLILVEKFSAYQLGTLIALYEASTVIQGFIWGINSFDQWGVQIGKEVAGKIEKTFFEKETSELDSSTKNAIIFLN